MYIAEIHGKLTRVQENLEDVLTSNVFSFLKYTPREIFLLSYLQEIGIEVSEKEAKAADFLFWTTYGDRTEPDLVIIVGDYYLLFEAKYYSGFGEESVERKAQLVRELEGGLQEASNWGKEFYLITITADHYQPPDLKQYIPKELHKYLIWTNWQSFAFFLSSILETREYLPSEIRAFASDLYALLDKKNLRQFEGKKALSLKGPKLIAIDLIFFSSETAKYRGDFIGFSSTLMFEDKITFFSDSIFLRKDISYFSSLFPASGEIDKTDDKLYFQGGRK